MSKGRRITVKSIRQAKGRPRDPATLALLQRLGLPADFPLSPHEPSSRWYKKVRGKRHYFGKLDDPQAALDLWLQQRDDLQAGRKPRPATADGVTVKYLCNSFLTSKRQLVDTGELSGQSWHLYFTTCQTMGRVFGRSRVVVDLDPADFAALRAEFAKTCGPVALGNRVQRVRTVFKWGWENRKSTGMTAPADFGSDFKKPKPAAMRMARAAKPRKLYTPAQVRTLIDAADVPMRAMVLLAINAALGNEDVARLERRHIGLNTGTLHYARVKTGIDRRAILWPETVEAIRAALEVRPDPIDPIDADLVFVTKYRRAWIRREVRKVDAPERGKPDVKLHNVDAVGQAFKRLCKAKDVPALGFYALRHTFATIAEQTRDFPAVELVMGHEDYNRMSTRYREGIEDDRLRAVAAHVRGWLGLAREDTAVLAKIG